MRLSSPTLSAQHPLAHTSDTTSTSRFRPACTWQRFPFRFRAAVTPLDARAALIARDVPFPERNARMGA